MSFFWKSKKCLALQILIIYYEFKNCKFTNFQTQCRETQGSQKGNRTEKEVKRCISSLLRSQKKRFKQVDARYESTMEV